MPYTYTTEYIKYILQKNKKQNLNTRNNTCATPTEKKKANLGLGIEVIFILVLTKQ